MPHAHTPADRPSSGGTTVWLTGLPSAGKTTIATLAAERFAGLGRPVEVLDGDELRRTLCAELGFSPTDRDTNVRRIGFVAQLLARNGIVVLVPVIAPYARSRAAVARHHADRGTGYLEVFVDAPVAVCERRDVKGLYARQRAGEIRGLTGVDDPYESPARSDLHLRTDRDSADRCASAVVTLVMSAAVSAREGRAADVHEEHPMSGG